MAGDGLTDIERARNIGGEQQLPFLDRKVLQRRTELHAGVVDQNIDRTGLVLDRFDAVFGGLGLGHVETSHRYLVPGRRQSRRRGIELGCIAAVKNDFGAVLGKALRKRQTDTLRRAGNERPLAGQRKQFKCHMTIPAGIGREMLMARATS